jgi:glycosyltransferase involved in cell wall biosynthesis
MTVQRRCVEVDIIIPTLAQTPRRHLLARALQSLLTQEGARVRPIVVINGQSPDPELIDELCQNQDIELVTRQEPGIPGALYAGRQRVQAPFFGTLDDDDLLLPHALAARIALLLERHDIDAVVSNGIRREPDGDQLLVTDMAEVEADPIRYMMCKNWLLPGGFLARTERVTSAVFDGIPGQLENTFLGLRLACRHRLAFIAEPGVVWFTDSPGAAHEHSDYVRGMPAALLLMHELPLPSDVHRMIDVKVGNACHSLAQLEWNEGNLLRAFGWHLRSLAMRGGWRYLLFTRKLLGPRRN